MLLWGRCGEIRDAFAIFVLLKKIDMGRRDSYEQKEGQQCLECGDPVLMEDGRADRKFCCVECKNRYHYRNRRKLRILKGRIHGTLERNYEILDGLVKLGVSSVDRNEAALMGLDLTIMTSCYHVKGHLECACYDITYPLTDKKLSNISKCLTKFAP